MDILKVADDFCHVQGMKLSFNFCQADLTQPLKPNAEKALCKADIVTMVYFLSAVNRRKDTEESRCMVRKIMTRLPKGSFLFFLDSAHDLNYIQMSEEADSLPCMTQIYRPQLEYLHTLSLNSVKTFLEIHKEDFGRLLCMTHCFVSVGAWISMGDILDIVGLPSLKISKGKLCSKFDDLQKASRLTRRMLDYRAKVHKLMASQSDGTQSESGFEDDDEENDPSENWVKRFSEFVPEYFFQTKVKKGEYSMVRPCQYEVQFSPLAVK
ncbi:uncharacterized protein CEXT_378361 [Caerostris extrusa]|uniref:Uncharacterized protein n=1 Tax=Caerostris extrusa TaxID=172846 RepID=A0AAV4Q0A5_CAEEX|nr:uncharacterized protein CEXT_378361 [Caerostris extrusa]